jgi:very-short-patch-repair endonuclease
MGDDIHGGHALPAGVQEHVFRECLAAIDRSSHAFAWIEDLHCYGSIWELGYAYAKEKSIYVASPEGVDLGELWFTGKGAVEVSAQAPVEGFHRFRRSVETSAALHGAVESPIERRLLSALRRSFKMLRFSDSPCWTNGDLELRPQREAGRYRLDFAIESQRHKWKLAIECDGHAFHERTKEQAQHDKSRDRDLVGDGWTVLRFTGSEIHKNAAACADQILETATELSRRECA